jgi:hypothetical protein
LRKKKVAQASKDKLRAEWEEKLIATLKRRPLRYSRQGLTLQPSGPQPAAPRSLIVARASFVNPLDALPAALIFLADFCLPFFRLRETSPLSERGPALL